MSKVSKKAIISAAKELNKVMGLEPRIDVKKDIEEVKALVVQASEWLTEDDVVSEETTSTLDELKREAGQISPEVIEDSVADAPKENDSDDTADAEDAPEKSKGKGKGKKEGDAPTPEKKDMKRAGLKKFGESFTRGMAAGVTVRNAKAPASIDDLSKEADRLYVDNTGNKSNPKEARWAMTIALQALIGYGAVTYKDGLVSNKKS